LRTGKNELEFLYIDRENVTTCQCARRVETLRARIVNTGKQDWHELIGSLNLNDSQLRIFAVACVRAVWPWVDIPDLRAAVEVAERVGHGLATPEELHVAETAAIEASQLQMPRSSVTEEACEAAKWAIVSTPLYCASGAARRAETALAHARTADTQSANASAEVDATFRRRRLDSWHSPDRSEHRRMFREASWDAHWELRQLLIDTLGLTGEQALRVRTNSGVPGF
jgi:hypothetical protein